jgi:hypothetical protein
MHCSPQRFPYRQDNKIARSESEKDSTRDGFFSENFSSELEKELVSRTKSLRQSTYMHLTER